jgi:tetratricopeptide (TPR) repeat protein/predicted Ser/Thr protein kinase
MPTQRLLANRYALGDLIGRGGMGAVFRGTDARTGAAVAIKELRQDLGALDLQLLERFEREAETLRRLDHPNIVKILDTFEEDERQYLVMEYVAGGSLDALLRRARQLPIRRALEIGLDLADALARVHRLQIVHRDIKPANVLLAEDGTPRLTDFGAAYVGAGTRITETGVMIGTFAYLSPEVCEGQLPDARADLWAFGVLLFEMLAGRRPFEAGQPGALLNAILTRPAPDLRQLRPDVPPALADLVAQLLEKNRERRIASARLVGATIEEIMRGVPEEPARHRPGPTGHGHATTPDSATIEAPSLLEQLLTERGLATPPAQETERENEPATFPPVAARPRPWRLLVAAALLAALLGAATLPLWPTPGARQATMLVPQETTPLPATPEVIEVAPVVPGERMVLVARLEQLGGEPRDESRFIVDNLTQTLEVGAPFSRIRVRAYPRVISSAEGARAAAEASGATLVVWGNDQGEHLEVNVHAGAEGAFPGITIDRSLVEQAANVRLRLADARRESVAPYVLGALSLLQNADGDAHETVRTIAIMGLLEGARAEPLGSSVATHFHRATALFADDPEAAAAELDQAIALSGGNPILYTSRGLARQRAGRLEDARRDIETARRIGPQGWTIPGAMLANDAVLRGDLAAAVAEYDRIIAARPEDWFPHTYRGALLYLGGETERARTDLERAIALGPNANYPYALAALVATREGRVADAAALVGTILRDYPDPALGNRMMRGVFGETAPNDPIGPLLASFTNLALGQYDAALAEAELVSLARPDLLDGPLLHGLAACSLGRHGEAEAAYARGLALAPGDGLLHLLRAEARLRLGNTGGAEEDLAAAGRSPLAPYADLVRAGDLGCATIFAAS